MGLQPGTRFGPYEIVSLAGSGGMGEVYRARDTRLGRTVAIKVLQRHLSYSAELSQRFDREAQTIASLKHPHICVLHDVGREADMDFLVMEYVDGETLADRLARGKSDGVSIAGRGLKLHEALGVAIQIAEALDQAHRQGIVHRDLKPANVMLMSGAGSELGAPNVKLLDFGLAKLTAPVEQLESALTAAADISGPGMVIGTMRYMAPEQVEGKIADARTDIFAFGVVLYEMLTGVKAFDGKSQASVIGAIMNAEPAPLSALAPATPRSLDRLVTRCLAKDPDERWQTAHDLALQLRWIAGRGSGASSGGSGSPARHISSPIAIIVGCAALIAAFALPAFRYVQGPPAPEEFRFRVPAVGLRPADIAISPDGESIAMVAQPGGQTASLYVRPVGAVTFRKLAGTDNAAQPFWSPDSRSIGFVAGGRLKKVAGSGEPPQELGSVEGFFGGTWSADATILFGSAAGIRRISAEGGASESITTVSPPETGHYWPHFLPDGRHYLYLAWSSEPGSRAVFVGDVSSKDRKRLVTADSNPVYSPAFGTSAPGYLLFRREGTVLAQPFDARRLALSGEPAQVAGDVAFNAGNGRGDFDVSRSGSLIFFQGAGAGTNRAQASAVPWQFGWHDRAGKLLTVAGEPGPYGDMDVSPDGKLIAVTRQDPGAAGSDIWVIDWQRSVSTRLTLDPGDDFNPVWAPDGKRIAFTTFRKGNADIFVKNANGVGPETPLLDSPADEFIEDWSKDGRYIVYKLGQGEFEDLYALPLDEQGKAGKPFPVVQGRFHKDEPQFSYDGKWLAYGSDESGTWEVYVTSFPALDQKLKVTDGGGARPRWRQDGKELFYATPIVSPTVMVAVELKLGPKIEAGTPHELFSRTATADPTRHLWAVSPDGQRILQRTADSISGARSGAFPTVANLFALSGRGAARGVAPTNVVQSSAASNGLTVVRNWPSALRKAAK